MNNSLPIGVKEMLNYIKKANKRYLPSLIFTFIAISSVSQVHGKGSDTEIIDLKRLKGVVIEELKSKNDTTRNQTIAPPSTKRSGKLNAFDQTPKKASRFENFLSFFFDESYAKTQRHELIEAIIAGRLKVVQEYINTGVNINSQHPAGIKTWPTPLMVACEKGQEEIAQLLITSGADLNAILLDLHLSSNEIDRNAGAHPFHTALSLAAQNGHCRIVNLLLNAGVDANIYSSSKPDHLINCLYKLIDKDDFDLDRLFFNNQCLLTIATIENRNDIVDRLINIKQVNLNLKDLNGNTALMIAAQKGHYEILKMLIDAGADLNILNQNNETAAILAFYNEHIDCLEELIMNDAHLSINNIHELKSLENIKSRMNLKTSMRFNQELINNLPLSQEFKLAIIEGNIEAVKKLATSFITYWGNCTPDKECALALAVITEQTEIFTYLCKTWNVPTNPPFYEKTFRAILDWVCFLEPTNLGTYFAHSIRQPDIYE